MTEYYLHINMTGMGTMFTIAAAAGMTPRG